MKNIPCPFTYRLISRLSLLLIILFFAPFFVVGQDLEVVKMPVEIDIQEGFGMNTLPFRNDPMTKKIGAHLLAAMKMYDQGMDMKSEKSIHVEEDKILIQAFARSEAEAQDLLNNLNTMGLTDGVRYKHIINGMFPFDKVESTMGITSMRSISASIMPGQNIGSVTSEGDQAMRTDILKSTYGVDGSGLKIGILSDAFNTLGGAIAGIASGDLPGPGNPNGFNTPVEVLSELGFTRIDEGRAMAELIHDIAPGANLAFHTAFNGIADFAQGIKDLRQAGCNIIVDDVFYFAQPYFQDDIVGQAVDEVVADGALYFSSAGNTANRSYDNAFNPGGFLFDYGGGLVYEPHDWGGGDYFLEVVLQPGQDIDLWLQWDEPSILASPVGATQDIDILVFNEDLTTILGGSFMDNPSDGRPVENIRETNSGVAPLTLNIFIGRWSQVPGNPNRIKFIDFDSPIAAYENIDEIIKSTVVGHPNTDGAVALGAAAYFSTPQFGVDPALINSFSSVGGTPILFDPMGARLASPIVRLKPDLTGPDGTNNTFFGGDAEPDGFPNFFGTSASAPHVAALAALMKEAEPYVSNELIRNYLIMTAEDMDDPRGVHFNQGDTNFDFATGYGFVNGLAALEALQLGIPTLGQWGIIILSLIILVFGVVGIKSGFKVVKDEGP